MEFFLIMFVTFILAIAIASGGIHFLFKQLNEYLADHKQSSHSSQKFAASSLAERQTEKQTLK